jgi:hypothetical protein
MIENEETREKRVESDSDDDYKSVSSEVMDEHA